MLDTSVLASGLRSRRGAANALLRLIAEGRLRALASPPLFLEYEDVLLRPEQRLAHGFSEMQIGQFLTDFAARVEPVEIHFSWRPQTGDPGDEMVLEAALNGHADALVTHNLRDFAAAGLRFGLAILAPHEVLQRLQQ